ncbi:MAG: hypothetical protein Q9162_005717 [Coniocarpon cinnabarinum]
MALSEDAIDLSAAWERTCKAFYKSTGRDLRATPVPTPEQVITSFSADKAEEDKKHHKVNEAKKVVRQTLDAVDRIGTVAAQGASMVFGPSTLCMNAVSFFVQAGVAYRGIFDAIDQLFGRIFDALERFQIYQEQQGVLPREMISIANEILVVFVRVFEKSYNILNKPKIVLYLKAAAFSGDEGVNSELEQLARLEEREKQIKETLNLVSARITERTNAQVKEGVDAMRQSLSKAENVKDAKRQREKISRLLGEPKDHYRSDYRRYTDSLIPNTGKWLQNDDIYLRWSSKKSDPCLVGLSARRGHGKTHAITMMIKDLQKRYPQGGETVTRASVAYVYVGRDQRNTVQSANKDGSSHAAGNVSPGLILKTLAWQIAENDPIYRRDLEFVEQSAVETGDVRSLWNTLFVNQAKSDATLHLLVDGLDDLDDKYQPSLRNFLEEFKSTLHKDSLRVKLMISAEPKYFEDLASFSKIQVPTIDLSSCNVDDMSKYISFRVDGMKNFLDKSDDVQALKNEVKQVLVDCVKGDFNGADLLLKDISGKSRSGEVRDVLDQARKRGTYAVIDDAITYHNENSKSADVDDLNTLLLWITHAKTSLSLEELRSILFWHHSELSLRPLYQQIKEDFHTFFSVSPDRDWPIATVTLTSDSIEECLRRTSRRQALSAIPRESTVSKAEVRLVQNFLRTFCDQQLYDNLGLESFLNSKLSSQKTRVQIDFDSAETIIALKCLQTLPLGPTHSTSRESESLIYYAGFWFYDHLAAGNLSLTDPQLKADVGQSLVKLLCDENVIAELYDIYTFFSTWLYHEELEEQVVRWFNDAAVVKDLTSEQGAWCERVCAGKENLFAPFARVIARKWALDFLEKTIEEETSWLMGYLNLLEHKRDPSFLRPSKAPYTREATVDDVLEVITFVAENIDHEKYEPKMVRNLGLTFKICRHYTEALQHLERAAQLRPWDKDITYLIAQTHSDMECWQMAIDTMTPILVDLQDGKDVFLSGEPRVDIDKVRFSVASWMRKLREFDKASNLYEDMLRYNPQNYAVVFAHLQVLYERKCYTSAFEYLERMQQQHDELSGRDKLSQLFHDHAEEPEYHQTLTKLVQETGQSNRMKSLYERALEVCHVSNLDDSGTWMPTVEELALMRELGTLLYFGTSDNREHALVIEIWERLLSAPKNEEEREKYVDMECIKHSMLSHLSQLYVNKALENEDHPEIASKMIERLKSLCVDEQEEIAALSPMELRRLLAIYYSRTKQEGKAREQLKPDVELGLELLSDDDTSNDKWGWKRLASVFATTGDVEAAIAAWCIFKPTTKLKKSRKSQSQLSNLRINVPRVEENAQAVGNLVDVSLDSGGSGGEVAPSITSLQGVQNGHLQTIYTFVKIVRMFSWINGAYKSFEMVLWNIEDAKVGHGNVKVGEEIMSVEAWLKKIRTEWDLEKNSDEEKNLDEAQEDN